MVTVVFDVPLIGFVVPKAINRDVVEVRMSYENDQRVLRTQRHIKNSFIQLLQSKGYNKITIQDIADESEINRNTFYLHFRDKEDLLEKLCLEKLSAFKDCFRVSPSLREVSDHQLTLYQCLEKIFDHVEGSIDFYLAITQAKGLLFFYSDLQKTISGWFREAIHIMLLKISDYEKDLYCEYLASALAGCIFYWLENRDKYLKQDAIKYLFDIHSKCCFLLFEE